MLTRTEWQTVRFVNEHLEGGSGVLPLFWAICMLVVQLQHLVIEQLQEVDLQRCSWKPICSLGKQSWSHQCVT